MVADGLSGFPTIPPAILFSMIEREAEPTRADLRRLLVRVQKAKRLAARLAAATG